MFSLIVEIIGAICKPLFAELFNQLRLAGAREVKAMDAATDPQFADAWRASIAGRLRAVPK